MGEDGDGQQAEDGHQHGHDACPGGVAGVDVEGVEGDAGGGVAHHDAGVLEADEGDEQSDAGGDGHLDLLGDALEDQLSKAGEGEEQEDQAVHQHQHQGVGVGETHAQADGVDEVGIETHAGGLRQGQVGQEADEHGAHDGGEGGGNVDRAIGDVGAEGGEHACVDHEDVGHGHEGGESGKDLSTDG